MLVNIVYECAGVVELVLFLLENSGYVQIHPLGGGPMQQLEIVFGAAFIVTKVLELSKGLQRKRRDAHKTARRSAGREVGP